MSNTTISPSPRVKIVQTYQCSDGTYHLDLEKAELHDAGLSLMQTFMQEGFTNDGLLKRICLQLTTNAKFNGHLDALRNIEKRAVDRRKREAAKTARNDV